MSTIEYNIAASWIAMAVGSFWGAALGVFFHRDDFLGGYESFRRRLLRLGHIACFGLAFVNLGFAFTATEGFVAADAVAIPGTAFVIALITMPLACAIVSWRKEARHLFAIPVAATVVGIGWTLWGSLS